MVSNRRKVYLVWGQSNADGRNVKPCPVADSSGIIAGVNMLNISSANLLFEPMKIGGNAGSETPSKWAFDSVALFQIADFFGEPVFVIKATRGGTSMHPDASTEGNWRVPFTGKSMSQIFFDRIKFGLDRVCKEGYEPDIKCAMGSQGESDCNALYSPYYMDYMLEFMYATRTVCRNKTLPFIHGTVSRNSSQFSSVIENSMYQIASQDPNFHLIDNKSKTLFDSAHTDAPSTILYGNENFELLKVI